MINDPKFADMGISYYHPPEGGREKVYYPYRLRLQACKAPPYPSFSAPVEIGEINSPGSLYDFRVKTAARVAKAKKRGAQFPDPDRKVAMIVRGGLWDGPGRFEALEVLALSTMRSETYDFFFVYDETMGGKTPEEIEARLAELKAGYPYALGTKGETKIHSMNPYEIVHQCLFHLGEHPDIGSSFGANPGWAFGPELVATLFWGCADGSEYDDKVDRIPNGDQYDLFWFLEMDATNTGADPVAEFFEACDLEDIDHRLGIQMDKPVDMISAFPLHMGDRHFPMSGWTNYLNDDVSNSFHNLIVIQRFSRRLLHKYWKNAAECGLGGYCEVAITNLCGLWPECTSSFIQPAYTSGLFVRMTSDDPAPDCIDFNGRALQTLQAAANGNTAGIFFPTDPDCPNYGIEKIDRSDYGTWVHKSEGYSCQHGHDLLVALSEFKGTKVPPNYCRHRRNLTPPSEDG